MEPLCFVVLFFNVCSVASGIKFFKTFNTNLLPSITIKCDIKFINCLINNIFRLVLYNY